MVKFFKQYLQMAPYSELFQCLILLVFFLIFLLVLFLVMKKPKVYYKQVSELPLWEDNDS